MTYTSSVVAKNCPVCGATLASRFLRMRDVPVNCSALWRSQEKARQAVRGDIELAFCPTCGMIFNAAFDPNIVEYDVMYDNSLAYSPAFQKYAGQLASDLVEQHALHGKDIVEIGCGRGDFLEKLCAAGGNRGAGFDPSAEPRSIEGVLHTEARPFTADCAAAADFVCCRHVLEHIPNVRELLSVVWTCLHARGGSAYFEVPDAYSVLNGPATWDIIYPHCSYFTAASLRYLFESCGFEVQNIKSTFGGHFLGIEARVSTRSKTVSNDPKATTSLLRTVKHFDIKLRETIYAWSRFLEYVSVEGLRVALWGAGAKAVTFLNSIPGADRIGAVVDLNPRKQGSFVPGTGQPVLAPEFLAEYAPEVVIILNPQYQLEIERILASMKLNSRVMLDPTLPVARPSGVTTIAAV